ncbi:MAG TPA: outer membrane lipoprotein carrier protein LolA [Pyrinomonadaceae bacterium]|nr:outer membrane lipoprotein carrier protein LolA [Pyrinomonadaceae bacterium]
MKKIIQYFVLTAIAVFAFGAVSQTNAQDQVVIRELYNRMGENQKTLKSLRSKVRMEKYNSQLRESEGAQEGTVLYIPSGGKSANVRIDWTYPQQETLSVVNGEYRLYRPRLEQVIKGKTSEVQKKDAGSGLQFINMSAQELKQNFDAKWLGSELIANGTISTYKLKLTPKKPMQYAYAEVWVTPAGMPTQVKMYEKNGDWTNILLFNSEKNASIKLAQLKLSNLPKNVKEIKG